MSKKSLKILIPRNANNIKKHKKNISKEGEEIYTKNIVYKEIL
jgi:hypothetical protein